MSIETDLESVKKAAKALLNVPYIKTEYSPMIIIHPFTKSGIVALPLEEYMLVDITRSKHEFDSWKEFMAAQIDFCDDVNHIFYLLNDSYRLMFVSDVSKFLSSEDFYKLLGDAWVENENANEDVNVSKREMLEIFRNADKEALMSESELDAYNDLDDVLIVYRGVSTEKKERIEALSWTISFGKAKWFADRWGDSGAVYSATINKQDVLAYFDRKGEDEVIIDFTKLQNVKEVTKPQPKPEPQEMQ